MYNIPAVILAGGKSRRMGRDKALLPFQGYSTLSEFQYAKLKCHFADVYLSSKENKFPFRCTCIRDMDTCSSPLVALVSLFSQIKTDNIFILSVDTPLVTKEIIDRLCQVDYTRYDAVVAAHKNGTEPLCAIYNRTLLQEAKNAIEKEEHALHKLLKNATVKYVYFENSKSFTNLNYPETYEKLRFG